MAVRKTKGHSIVAHRLGVLNRDVLRDALTVAEDLT